MVAMRSKTMPAQKDFSAFLTNYQQTLRSIFRERASDLHIDSNRGLPPSITREILSRGPLTPFIPASHGGRGEQPHESLAVLDATSYESLGLCLTLGINGALFLQPVSKYAREEVKGDIFGRFLLHQNMGGLMMTEPDFGSDALNMRTSFLQDGDGGRFHIKGVKHWAGLTGLADYWLVLARSRGPDGALGRDIGFFIADSHRPEQAVQVEEMFDNLGLYQIPYGRSRIDVQIPEEQRLVPHKTGLTMMLDLLHRSRLQFPGIALGFLRRMLDEAVEHVQQRNVGGKSLFSYDQVRRRIARMQATVTAATAMCTFSAEHAHLSSDLSKEGIRANALKAVVTDFMHEAAQSLLQLVGAKGYRFGHIAGRSLVDSRPFQIFEGSNDILYEQLAQSLLKLMQRRKHVNLHDFLASYKGSARAAELLKNLTDFRLGNDLPQRSLVDLGRVLGLVITMEMVVELRERGYSSDLISNCLEQLRQEVASRLATFRSEPNTSVVEEFGGAASWLDFVRTRPA